MNQKLKAYLLVGAVVLNITILRAQPLKSNGNGAPKLVVGIVVENMRPDYVDRFWDKFGNDGFKKLYQKGTVCTNFKIEQHIQSYASGTATLFTGVYPATHGIIDYSWYDRLKEKQVNCIEDDYYFSVGSDTKAGNASPLKLMANTISDNLKLYTQGKSKIYSVALNAESSILSAGHAADAAYWLDEEAGRMISSSFYLNTFPDWVRLFNAMGLPDRYAHRNWVTLLPAETYTESVDDLYILEKGYFSEWKTFPHSLNRYVKKMGNYNPIKTTPYGNSIILDFTKELIAKEPIGTDHFTDMLTVVFSSMDYENGSFGPVSVEMEDTYLYLDKYIAELITTLEQKYSKDEIIIYLTSNTSASYSVDYLKAEYNLNVGYFSPESAIALLTSFLNITYGDNKWIENITGQQFYFDHKLIEKNNIDKDEIIQKAAEFINQFEGVKVVLTADDLQRGGNGTAANAGMYNSFSKNRSGDFSYVLEEGWQPSYKFKRVNYTDQTHIPLVFYGKGIVSKHIRERHLAIDLVPTLSDLIGIPPPDRSLGNIIEGISNAK